MLYVSDIRLSTWLARLMASPHVLGGPRVTWRRWKGTFHSKERGH